MTQPDEPLERAAPERPPDLSDPAAMRIGSDPTGSMSDTTLAADAASQPTELRTFLIADIRGYTVYTREHGDEAAAALAARFAELVAEVVTAREGFLLELRGDEALVVFVSARKALRAAIDLQERFVEAELPRGVGIGLDAGEAIPIRDGYRGTALNLAARLCAQAGPGEILASEAVIHLAAKVDGISYVDARSIKLKGYDHSVRAVMVVPTAQAKGRRPLADGADGLRRRWLGLGAAGLALTAVASLVLWAGYPGPSAAPSASPSGTATVPGASDGPFALAELPVLAFYDATTGRAVATTSIRSPSRVAVYADGSYWQVTTDPKSVFQIDPETRAEIEVFEVPVDQALAFAFSPEALWFSDLSGPWVHRLDRRTKLVSRFEIGASADDQGNAGDIVVGAGSVWFSRPDDHEIVRMDPTTGAVLERIPIEEGFTVDFGNGALWYGYSGLVGRIDPATNRPDTPIRVAPGKFLTNIAFAGGFAWVSEPSEGILYKLDRTKVVEAIPIGPGIYSPSATADTVWVANNRDGTVTGVDVVTSQTRTIDTGHATLSIAASEDELMVAVGPTVDDILGQLGGDVLDLAVETSPWDDPSPDPPVNWTLEARQLESLTCLGLMAYPVAPALDPWTLQPEAAAAMPIVSPDGRTYTFTIRPGLVFSPPSEAPITAETFRASIERALSPALVEWAPGPIFLDDIVGAKPFREGTTPRVEGLEAEGDRLTITLENPSATFLARLALPFYCPVPTGTPPARLGLDTDPPVSGSGPYYVAEHLRDRLVVLERNPNYGGERRQPFDAIAVHVLTSVSDMLTGIRTGRFDGAMLPGDTSTGPGSQLQADWGETSEAAAEGRQRWFGATLFATSYLALNPDGALGDPALRRAVALAVDRAALARIWPIGPTADLLPSSLEGVTAATVPVPDIDAARTLLAGRNLELTLATLEAGECEPCDAFAAELAAQLQTVGITVQSQGSDDPWADADRPDTNVDLVELGFGSEIPDVGALLVDFRDRPWVPADRKDEIDHIQTLTGQARIDAANALARQLTDDDLVIPYGSPVYANYFASDIGCAAIQPAIGAVDLSSLCRLRPTT